MRVGTTTPTERVRGETLIKVLTSIPLSQQCPDEANADGGNSLEMRREELEVADG
jgi:hypothetical protein